MSKLATLFFFTLFVSFIGCESKTTTTPTTGKGLSKAEWRAKFVGRFGELARLGIIGDLNPAQFKSVMGEPNKTQTIGDQAFWYFQCSDGVIQLELHAPNLAVGVMQGKVNDY